MESNSCILHECGRLIANDVINAFKKGAWKYNVDLQVEKTTPRWFSTTIDIRFTWKGKKEDVNGFTSAAQRYINEISSY